MNVKKTALILCNNNKRYWIRQRQFWDLVRDGIVTQTGDQPLRGRFRGRDDQLLILINHVVFNLATPEHTSDVLHTGRVRKKK